MHIVEPCLHAAKIKATLAHNSLVHNACIHSLEYEHVEYVLVYH